MPRTWKFCWMFMNPVHYSSTPRRESCFVKAWVQSLEWAKHVYMSFVQSGQSYVYSKSHPHQLQSWLLQWAPVQAGASQCHLLATRQKQWVGRTSEGAAVLIWKLSLTHRSSCVVTGLLTACFHAGSAFHKMRRFSGQCCTLLSLLHIGCFSLPQEGSDCTNPWQSLAIRYNPFLMHSRILLRETSNHTSVPPRLHPAPGLQRT